MVFDPTTAFRAPVAVKLPPGLGRKLLWILAVVVLLPVLGVVLVTCGILVTANKAIDQASGALRGGRSVRTGPAQAIAPATKAKVAPAALDPAKGWQVLDCAPPPGGAARLDAVAAIPWALALATAWRPDARLERVDVDRLRPDGLVDAQGDPGASVMFRFLSPALLEEQRRQADLGRSDVKAGLFVEVKGGEARGLPTTAHTRGEGLPPAPASLPLAQVLQGLERAGKLPAKPYYRGYLIHIPDEGWVWYLNTLGGRESIPRTRAADGRPWPFR